VAFIVIAIAAEAAMWGSVASEPNQA